MQRGPIAETPLRNSTILIRPTLIYIFISLIIIVIGNAILVLPSHAVLKLGSQDRPAAIILGSNAGLALEPDPIDDPGSGDQPVPIILSSPDLMFLDPPPDPRSRQFMEELGEIRDLQAISQLMTKRRSTIGATSAHR